MSNLEMVAGGTHVLMVVIGLVCETFLPHLPDTLHIISCHVFRLNLLSSHILIQGMYLSALHLLVIAATRTSHACFLCIQIGANLAPQGTYSLAHITKSFLGIVQGLVLLKHRAHVYLPHQMVIRLQLLVLRRRLLLLLIELIQEHAVVVEDVLLLFYHIG